MDKKTKRLKRLDKILRDLYTQVEQNSELCDVTLECKGHELKCHWNILVACPFFEAVYRNNLQEKKTGRISMELGNPRSLRHAIGFLYGRKVLLNDENVSSILEISDFLMIEELRNMCIAYVQQIVLNTDNCLELYKLHHIYDLKKGYTLDELDDFIKGNLPVMLQKEGAVHFSKGFARSLATDQDLHYVPREDILVFLVTWVNSDPTERKDDFLEIVRLLETSVIEGDKFDRVIQGLSFCVPKSTMIKPKCEQNPRAAIVFKTPDEDSRRFYALSQKPLFMYANNQETILYKLQESIPYHFHQSQISSSGSTLYCLQNLGKETDRTFRKQKFYYFTKCDFKLHSWNPSMPFSGRSKDVVIEDSGIVQPIKTLKLVDLSNSRFVVCRTSEKKCLLCEEREATDSTVTYKSIKRLKDEVDSAVLVSEKYVCAAIGHELHVYCTENRQCTIADLPNEFGANFDMYPIGSGLAIMKSVLRRGHTGEYLQINIEMCWRGLVRINQKNVHLRRLDVSGEVLRSLYRYICGQWYCVCEMNRDNPLTKLERNCQNKFWATADEVNIFKLDVDGSDFDARWKQLNLPSIYIEAIKNGEYIETLLSNTNACTMNCPHCTMRPVRRNYGHFRSNISDYKEFSSDDERKGKIKKPAAEGILINSLQLQLMMSSAYYDD